VVAKQASPPPDHRTNNPSPTRFGKRLAAEAARRWSAHYVDYKAIKKAIKDDIRHAGACLLLLRGCHH